ncbi:unnamed protein product [Dovyalis caffra]|uniref:RING-type domain-containing protein n=1 Tax=Dovyalis caffra TaxID=77055 RepID=A0AAV1RN43_9ROSI|nr:unnamed protein product [Dovyalis caffra]
MGASVIEETKVTKIRVFKWNEKLRNNRHLVFMDQGLFLLITKSYFNNGGTVQIKKGLSEKASFFELASLLSPDAIKSTVTRMLSSSAQFRPNTIPALALQISDQLTTSFRFQRHTRSTASNSPITVVVAEISRTLTVQNDMDVDFTSIVSILRNSVAVQILPPKPIAVDQPIGLVQVLPENALPIVHPFADGLGDMVGACPICLRDFSLSASDDVILKTPCSHLFHGKCIRRWLSRSLSCPMCRFLLT